MKNLLGLIVLFIIAASLLSIASYFQRTHRIPALTTPNIVAIPLATTTQESDKNPLLSPAQETALEKIGIDPSKLPTFISPEMMACFISKIGVIRVEEIKQGAIPTEDEVSVGRTCLYTK